MAHKTTKAKHNTNEGTVSSEKEKFGLERLIFFSDAVFAIAITLLALEIRLPTLEGNVTNEQLLQALLSIWPKYLGYLLSFLVIGQSWVVHHSRFKYIARYDRALLSLNILLLMFVAFIPFPTAIISEYPNLVGTVFYALAMVIVGLLSSFIWIYAAHDNRLLDPPLPLAQRRRQTLRTLVVPGIFLLSIGLAFINPDLAKYSWLLTAVVLRFI